MNIKQIVGLCATTMVVGAVLVLPAQAQAPAPIMSFQTPIPASGSPFSFVSDGAGGGTLITQAGGTLVNPLGPTATSYGTAGNPGQAYLEFINLNQVTGSAVDLVPGVIATAQFEPGAFVLKSAVDGSTLLSGTFGTSTFTATSLGGSGTGSLLKLDFADVIYNTSTTYGQEFLATYGPDPQLTGTFSLTFQGISPSPITVTGGGLSSFGTTAFQGGFQATSDGRVNINPVPEPEEYAVMGMASLALCGLMIRARRRSAGRTMGGFAA